LIEKTTGGFEGSAAVPLAEAEGPAARSGWPLAGLSLFWRTFILLSILLLGSILAWLQTLRAFEFEPRAVQTAQQLASQVNLSRAALVHADAIARVSLLKTMSDEEGLRIIPREPGDVYVSAAQDALVRDMAKELRKRLGNKSVVASDVNGQKVSGSALTLTGTTTGCLPTRPASTRAEARPG